MVQLQHGQRLVGQLRTALCWPDYDDFRNSGQFQQTGPRPGDPRRP
jgi:hypothetical protein